MQLKAKFAVVDKNFKIQNWDDKLRELSEEAILHYICIYLSDHAANTEESRGAVILPLQYARGKYLKI